MRLPAWARVIQPFSEPAIIAPIPYPDPSKKKKKVIPKGEIPSPIDPSRGCRFNTRCPYAKSICLKVEPEIREIVKGHLVKCHFPMN